MACRNAGLLIEGGQSLAATAAIVVGTLVGEGADEADDRAGAIDVVAGGLLAVRTGHAGAFVAVFF